jgi:hypothetical protein
MVIIIIHCSILIKGTATLKFRGDERAWEGMKFIPSSILLRKGLELLGEKRDKMAV